MNDETIEVYGASTETQGTYRGMYISVNVKNERIYLSRELSEVLFPGRDSGKMKIVHTKIEDNWYITSCEKTLFDDGFECLKNDIKQNSVFRVNGAKDVFKKIVNSLCGDNLPERCYLTVIETPINYDGMNLYKITFKK